MKPKKVKYIKRPNLLKMKAGHGGIPEDIISHAQRLIANFEADFEPEAQKQIEALKTARQKTLKEIKQTKKPVKDILDILKPIMTLKAHGGMFGYQLISDIADICLQFLEAINEYNEEALEIIKAHEKTMASIITSKLKGDGGDEGYEVVMELHRACKRYFEKYDLK